MLSLDLSLDYDSPVVLVCCETQRGVMGKGAIGSEGKVRRIKIKSAAEY